VREIDVARPSKRKGSGFELEVTKVPQGYAIEAVKIPLSGSVGVAPCKCVELCRLKWRPR
jgi:hypothetical protein